MRPECLIVAAALGASPVLADEPAAPPDSEETRPLWELSFEELMEIQVTSSSFLSLDRNEAPATGYILTPDLIARSPALHLKDLLEMYVPSVHMGSHPWWGPGLFGNRGILVDNNAKTIFMIDGFNINQRNIIGTGPIFALPLQGDVERYEVINGPGSVIHGSGAINGFVNAVSRTGASQPGLHATTTLGEADRLVLGEVSYGLEYGKERDLFVYAGFVQADGFRPQQLSWVEQPIPARLRAFDIGPSFKASILWNHGGLRLQAFHIHFLNSTQTPATLDSPALPSNLEDPWGRSTLLGLRPSYTWSIGGSALDEVVLSSGLLLQDSSMIARFPEREEAGRRLNVSNGGRETYLRTRVLFRTRRLPGNSLAVGAETSWRRLEDAKHFFYPPPRLLSFENQNLEFFEHAAFAEDVLHWGHWTVSGALRLDVSQYPDALWTRAGRQATRTELPTTWNLSKRLVGGWAATPALNLHLGYESAFRTPDAGNYQLAASGNRELETLGRPVLAPLQKESMDSVTANVRFEDTQRGLRLELAAYYNVYRGLLSFNNVVVNGASVRTFVNSADSLSSAGGEVIVGGEVRRSTRWELSYGYSRPVDVSAETNQFFLQLADDARDRWARYPTHQVKGYLTTGLWRETLVAHVNAVVQSALDPFDTRATHPVLGEKRLLLNAALTYAFLPRVAVKLGVLNAWRNQVPAINYANERPWRQNQLGAERRRVYLSLRVQ